MRVVTSGERQSGFKAVLEHIGIPLLCLTVTAVFTGLFFTAFTGPERWYAYSYSSSSSYYANSAEEGQPIRGQFSCNAGGEVIWPWKSSRNQYWDPALFLTITLASGDLTFTQAKAIDIIWDLIVGRGGQMLLSVLIYPSMRKSLLTALERRSMHMPVVASLTFEHFSIFAWWSTTRELVRAWSWRLFGLLFMIIYLLAFGTLVSAMTGYQANMEPFYIQQNSDNLMAFKNVVGMQGVRVLDSQRVGLEPDAIAFSIDTDPTWPLYQYYLVSNSYCQDYGYTIRSNDTTGLLTAANSSYIYSNYGNDDDAGNSEANSTFEIQWVKDRNATSRWRSAYGNYPTSYYGDGEQPIVINCTTSNITINNHTYHLETPPLKFNYSSTEDYYRDDNNNILNKTWLELNSQCQVLQTYQWGFSSLLLFSFCIATMLFFIALLALHIDVWQNSQTNRMKQHFSLYRDILDFAHQLKTEIGSKVDDMPAKDLEKSVAAQADFITVAAYEYPPSRAQQRRSRKKAKDPFNFRTDSIPRLRKMGSEFKAGHAYSMGEMKRSLGMTYGPIRKQTADSLDFA